MVQLIGVLGSVTPPGRLRSALAWTLEAASEANGGVQTALLDLADVRLSFADGRPAEQVGDDTASVVRRIGDAEAVLLASPVYRATYTGALKNLLDLLPIEALQGKPCGIIAMGASQHHYLGVDTGLRPVLAWFGALLPPTSVYLAAADFREGQLQDEAKGDLRALAESVLRLRAVAGPSLGPQPLAARRG